MFRINLFDRNGQHAGEVYVESKGSTRPPLLIIWHSEHYLRDSISGRYTAVDVARCVPCPGPSVDVVEYDERSSIVEEDLSELRQMNRHERNQEIGRRYLNLVRAAGETC